MQSPVAAAAEEELPQRCRDALAAILQGRRLVSPLDRQRPTFLYYPGLSTRFFFDERPPWALLLEQNWRAIREVRCPPLLS